MVTKPEWLYLGVEEYRRLRSIIYSSMEQEDKDSFGRRITNEYFADGEWHYEYKNDLE